MAVLYVPSGDSSPLTTHERKVQFFQEPVPGLIKDRATSNAEGKDFLTDQKEYSPDKNSFKNKH